MATSGNTRRITFTLAGNPPVLVTAVEQTGALVFTLDIQETSRATADLRGFFLNINPVKLSGLSVNGDRNLTDAVVSKRNVSDLGDGVTLSSRTRSKFDIGMEWGTEGRTRDDISGPVTFTLTNSSNNLTLDDIARQTFGAKLDSVGGIGTARTGSLTLIGKIPSAPLARKDEYVMDEDGSGAAANLIPADGETATPGITLNILANDRDGDRDVLTIDSLIGGAANGTLTIAADGRSLFYVPNEGWSGTEMFHYRVTDGKGGFDEASVKITVAAQADAPIVTVTAQQGANAAEILVTVTASLADTDGSEQITAIQLDGNVPSGVLVERYGQGTSTDGSIFELYRVTLPTDRSVDFDLGFTATSRERSNGATATTAASTGITAVQTTTELAASFAAVDQNIWSSGDSFSFRDDRFLGLDESFGFEVGDTIYAGLDASFKLGFQSTLELTAGNINAAADYDVTVDTFYNRTTDMFQIDTAATLLNAAFNTVGPGGSYTLDFLAALALNAYVGYDIGIDSGEYDLIDFSFPETALNIIDVSDADAALSVPLPDPFGSLSIDFAWPSISTAAAGTSPLLTGGAASNNFLQLNLDVVDLIATIIETSLGKPPTPGAPGGDDFDVPGIADLLNPPEFSFAGIVTVDATFLEVVVSAGLNFLQEFALQLGDLSGIITFEDDSTRAFTIGDSLTLINASAIDAAGNGDGDIDFSFTLAPDAMLSNETALGFNLGLLVTLFELDIDVDLLVDSYSESFGPLYQFDETLPIADISVFNDTFAFNFAQTELVIG